MTSILVTSDAAGISASREGAGFGGTKVKSPTSETSLSRMRSPRGALSTARVNGPLVDDREEHVRDADWRMFFEAFATRSMWSVSEGMTIKGGVGISLDGSGVKFCRERVHIESRDRQTIRNHWGQNSISARP